MGVSTFSSFWIPLALAEVTSYSHFMTDTGVAMNDAQLIKQHIDKVFIASCMVTNIVRNTLVVIQSENPIDFESVWAFQHLYFGVEGMTLLNIGCTMRLLNLAKYQNQEKVNVSLLGFRLAYHPIKQAERSIRLFLLSVLVTRELFFYVSYNITGATKGEGYNILRYNFAINRVNFHGLSDVLIATAFIHPAMAIRQDRIRQDRLVRFDC